MAQVVYSAAALADLERLAEFQLEQSPTAAQGALARILDAIGILAGHPLIGHRAEGEIRELVISHGSSGYMALYRFDAARDVVRVLRVRHQREAGYHD